MKTLTEEYQYQMYTREREGEMLRIFNSLPHDQKEFVYNTIKYAKYNLDKEKAAERAKEFEGYTLIKCGTAVQ